MVFKELEKLEELVNNNDINAIERECRGEPI